MSQIVETAIAALNKKLAEKPFAHSVAIEIRDEGTIRIDPTGASESDAEADCHLIANAKTFQGLMEGSINPMTSVMLGKLKVKGDPSIALKLSGLFG